MPYSILTRRRLLTAPILASALSARQHDHPGVDAEHALTRLMEGNRRFARSKPRHPDQSTKLRLSLSSGQHPFAIVLSCADSRVPPELVFDQGLGDLFVIRVAGNIVDDAVIGSIEYAAAHLGVPLAVVLGHQKCGAVQAAISDSKEAHIRTLAEAIQPAVRVARAEPGDLLDHAVRQNVKRVVAELTESRPILSGMTSAGKLKIVGGYYNLESGVVERVE